MSKETDKFLSLYRTYEGLLRSRGTDYRTIEQEELEKGNERLTIMRQMRNYMAHREDPGFLAISPLCLRVLERMVKEEALKGDIIKNHLITPAKGSIKSGTPLGDVVYRLSNLAALGQLELPVYDPETKRLQGIVLLERMAWELKNRGNIPIEESTCGPYGNAFYLVKPDDSVPSDPGTQFYCCTKDGTLDSPYLGYLDTGKAGCCCLNKTE